MKSHKALPLNFVMNLANTFSLILFLALIVFFVIQTSVANRDLANDPVMLDIDEKVTHFQWSEVLKQDSPWVAFKTLVTGDQRYGKVMYYPMIFLTGVLGWGETESDRIFLARQIQSTLLIFAYILLVLTFLKNWFWRTVALSFLIGLDLTAYYATMPKPEPIQLVFIAFSLWVFSITRSFGFIFFTFVGLVFGSKISGLPVALAMILLGVVWTYFETNKRRVWSFFSSALLPFTLGWFIAVPILFLGRYVPYINMTFLNTGHAQDSPTVGVFTWLSLLTDSISADRLWGPAIVGVGLVVICFSVLIQLKDVVEKWSLGRSIRDIPLERGLLFLYWTSFLLLTILFVKRPWQIYLFVGLVLFVVHLWSAIEEKSKNKLHSVVKVFACGLLCCAIPGNFVKFNQAIFELKTRSKSSEIIEKTFIGRKIEAFLKEKNVNGLVAFYPELFVWPTDGITYRGYFGPFIDWSSEYQALVLSTDTYQEPESEVPEWVSDQFRIQIEAAKAQLRDHVIQSGNISCRTTPCYQLTKRIGSVRIYLPALENRF